MKNTAYFQLALLVAIIISGLLAGCLREQAPKKTVRIAFVVWPGYAHAFIAREKGIFRNNDVDVELVLTKDNNETARLYRQGEVDGFFEVFTDVVILNSEGIPTKAVYVADYSDTGDVVIGRPELKSLCDLKGKTVGTVGINDFSHIFMLMLLERAGVKESEIRLKITPAKDVLSALEKGTIDAGHTWEPVISRSLDKGYRILGKAGDVPGLITDVLAFNAKIIKERPDDIRRTVKSMLEAKDFIYTHKDEALEIMSRFEEMSKGEMEKGISRIKQPGLADNLKAMARSADPASLFSSGKIITDFYLERGQLGQVPDLDDIIEPGFLMQINDRTRGKEAGK